MMVAKCRLLPFMLVALLLVLPGGAVHAGEPVAEPTNPPPAAVPDDTIAAMTKLLTQRPTGDSQEQMVLNRALNMDKVLDMGKQAETKHPDAPNLSQVHRLMLQAADFLTLARPGEDSTAQLNELVDRILKSPADVSAKVMADFARTKNGVQKNGKPTDDAAKQIDAFVDRYKDTPGAGNACAFGASLANMLQLTDLRTKYVQVLKDNHLDDPAVRQYLRALKEYSDIGQPFKATLTRLDGNTLTLPDDLKGKVVVIDFWATWCGPCRDEVPRLKAFYKEYKDKGVEIVGISRDETKAAVEKFVKQQGMEWIQTFDGRESQVPARYGINAIPTLFVVDKNGTVIAIDPRNLRETVDKALKE